MPPQISIITACLNRAALIPDAIESVLAQNYTEFEHIIVDGGSTDSTLALLSHYTHLQVVSERDDGIYDAINKGVARAHGAIIGLLNSDDLYEPGVFAMVARAFELHPEADVISGQATHFEEQDRGRIILNFFPAVNPQDIEQRLMRGVPIINAWFFRRKIFEQIGSFDQGFPIAADRDFQIRCWLNNIEIHPIDRLFYHYRSHEESLTGSGDLVKQEIYLRDMLRLAEKYIHLNAGNPEIRNKFIQWHDLTVFELFVSNMRRGNLKKSLEIIISALTKDPRWFLVLIVQIPLRLIRYLYGRINTGFNQVPSAKVGK